MNTGFQNDDVSVGLTGAELGDFWYLPLNALLCAEQGWQENRCLSLKTDRCMDVSALTLGPFVSNRKRKFKSRALRATVGLRCRKRKSKSAAVKVKYIIREEVCCFVPHFSGRCLRKRRLLVDSLPEMTVSETIKCTPIIH